MTWAAVRLRGSVNIRGDIKDTMQMLRLTRANHLVLLPEDPSTLGMLRKAKDYITWGTIQPKVLADLLRTRGRLEGDKPLTDAHVKEKAGYATIDELAEAICSGKVQMGKIPGLKPVLRLPPPRKGYEGVKRSFVEGGALGNRGPQINELLQRMGEAGR